METERRREARQALSLPVAVLGHTRSSGAWNEISATQDASSAGLALTLSHAVLKGHVLQIGLPLPPSLRQYDHHHPEYRVYAVVRNVLADDWGLRVGLMFLSKEPPRGHAANPGSRFVLPWDLGIPPRPAEPEPVPDLRRAHERFGIFTSFLLRHTDERGAAIAEEATVAENRSAGGARLLTSLDLAPGDVVRLREIGGPFEARARVLNTYLGPDRVRRLNLEFLDGRSSAHLVGAS